MAETARLHLTVVTRERKILDVQVDEVVLPGTEGEIGVLPGHTPLLASLRIGPLSYRTGGKTERLVISWGFAEVLPERVTVLAQIAERAQDIDVERAERAKQRAEERLRGSAQSDMDFERARIAMMVSMQLASEVHMRSVGEKAAAAPWLSFGSSVMIRLSESM